MCLYKVLYKRLFEYSNFDVIYRYSTIVKTMYVGSFYATIVPFTITIGLISLILNYWMDKVNCIKYKNVLYILLYL